MKNFTILSLFRLAIKHIFIILISAIVFAAAVFSYCQFIATPKYSATGSVLVTNGAIIGLGVHQYEDSTVDNADIIASMNFTTTIVDILKTNGIYKELANDVDNKYSYKELKAATTIKKKDDYSLFIDISFTATTPKEAVKLTNKYLAIAPDYIESFVPDSAARVSIADDAYKVAPNTPIYTLFAGVLGAGLSFLIILLIYSSNTVITGESDFKERFDLPVIGTVPDFSKAKTDKSYNSYGEYIRRGSNENGK